MIRVLNLYAGLGGNRALIPDQMHGTEIKITSVELNHTIARYYQQHYPSDELVIGDAHDFLLNRFSDYDIIWSSPPCQTHSRMAAGGRNRKPRYRDFKLYEEIDFLTRYFKGVWLVENVIPAYKPFYEYQKVGRHAYWSNTNLHSITPTESPTGFGNLASAEEIADWLGIDYEYNIYYDGNKCQKQVLRNCVHPKDGLAIFNLLFQEWSLL